MSPNYKKLPPLVITPPDDRIEITEFFPNRYRSHQHISNYNFNETLSPRSNTMRTLSHRQQSLDLIDSNQTQRRKFELKPVHGENALNLDDLKRNKTDVVL